MGCTLVIGIIVGIHKATCKEARLMQGENYSYV